MQEVKAVQVYMTSDEKVFTSKEEAEAHEAGLTDELELTSYGGALKVAGYSPSSIATMVRGVRLYKAWVDGKTIPSPVVREKKK
jgi:predicted HAD superfamily Cof-like phosphohydrolase